MSEHTPLFGFMEHGYRWEIVFALAAEAVAVAALGALLALTRRHIREALRGGEGTGAGVPVTR